MKPGEAVTILADCKQLQKLFPSVKWLHQRAHQREITSLNSTKRKGALKFYIRTRILQISRITALIRLEASDDKLLANNSHQESCKTSSEEWLTPSRTRVRSIEQPFSFEPLICISYLKCHLLWFLTSKVHSISVIIMSLMMILKMF